VKLKGQQRSLHEGQDVEAGVVPCRRPRARLGGRVLGRRLSGLALSHSPELTAVSSFTSIPGSCHRVLTSEGRTSSGPRWLDPDDTRDIPVAITTERITFDETGRGSDSHPAISPISSAMPR
jgi:hypothetical protein